MTNLKLAIPGNVYSCLLVLPGNHEVAIEYLRYTQFENTDEYNWEFLTGELVEYHEVVEFNELNEFQRTEVILKQLQQ